MPRPLDSPATDEQRLEQIALAHRALMRCWLVNLLCAPFIVVMAGLAVLPASGGLIFTALSWLPVAALSTFALISVWRLGAVMDEHRAGTILVSIISAIPLANLLLLFITAQETSEYLSGFCGRVPLFGFTPASFATARGACHGCGYDLRGLRDARCPECGRPVTPVPVP